MKKKWMNGNAKVRCSDDNNDINNDLKKQLLTKKYLKMRKKKN